MKMKPLKSRLAMFGAGVILFGMSAFGVQQIKTQVDIASNDNQLTAHMKLSSSPRPIPGDGWVEYMSEYDFIAFSPGAWDSKKMRVARDEVRKRNLDIQLGSYVHAFTAPQWTKLAYDRGDTGYYADWWEALSPYLAYTTEQDTAAIWKANYVFDVFNPVARAGAIEVTNKYIRRHNLEWMMLDFISVPLPNLKRFQNPIYEELEHGDLDFDQNGIGHWDDPAEQQALREIWLVYMDEMRKAFPKGFKIIPNGNLALKDEEFARKVDGCYVEGFPMWGYGADGQEYINAYDPEYHRSLWKLSQPKRWYTGQGYVMIEDRYNRGTYGYPAKQWNGVVEMKRQMGSDNWNSGNYVNLPKKIDTGTPIGDAIFVGEDIVREFEKGKVYIRNIKTNRPTYSFVETEVEPVADDLIYAIIIDPVGDTARVKMSVDWIIKNLGKPDLVLNYGQRPDIKDALFNIIYVTIKGDGTIINQVYEEDTGGLGPNKLSYKLKCETP